MFRLSCFSLGEAPGAGGQEAGDANLTPSGVWPRRPGDHAGHPLARRNGEKRGNRRNVTQSSMAWELRGRAGPYFTRSVRRRGKVRRIYYGKGLFGELAAAEDEKRRARRQRRLEEAARWAAMGARLRDLGLLSDLVLHACLVLGGYRCHHRGTWRRRRHATPG